MKFHEKLANLRADRNISQASLAEALDVTRQSVAKWELGKAHPSLDKLLLLSSFFGMSLDQLMRESPCDAPLQEPVHGAQEPIIAFLLRAKKNTYAAKAPEASSSRPASHDFSYTEDGFLYIDTYLGGECFAGEEAVWHNGIPVWAMNYVGRLLGEGFSGDFLREALLAVPADFPYRGPQLHRSGEYTYHCQIHGAFHWFQGYEDIFLSGQKIYECHFHGGTVGMAGMMSGDPVP